MTLASRTLWKLQKLHDAHSQGGQVHLSGMCVSTVPSWDEKRLISNRSSVTKANGQLFFWREQMRSSGFVFSEFFLEKQPQPLSYPHSMQWCLEENLSPPYPTCAYYRSQSHQHFAKIGQEKKNKIIYSPCFDLVGSLSQYLFCALDEQTAFKGPEECKSQICVWEQRLFISRILCCKVAEPLQRGSFWIYSVPGSNRTV